MSSNYDGRAQKGVDGSEQIDGLYRYAMILSYDHFEAAELVEETYARFMKTVHRGSAPNDLKAKLFAILRNIWINGARKQRICNQIVDADLWAIIQAGRTESYDHSQAIDIDEAEMVGAAIRLLSAESREIILLREYEDFSYREIADILNCPIDEVGLNLGRARSGLRVLLSRLDRMKPDHALVFRYK